MSAEAIKFAKYQIGQIVKHSSLSFRGIIFDVDPEFANTEEWYEAIPEPTRPHRDQPFYHILAENDDLEYVAYVSEQNLIPDRSDEPLRHPQISEYFNMNEQGEYEFKPALAN